MTSHYRTNLRDIMFNLFEANRVQDTTLAAGQFSDFDPDIVKDLLREVERLSIEDLAESFVDGDRIKLELVDGEVHIPDSVRKSLDAYYEGGWDRFALPESLGGAGSPPSVRWAAAEMIVGANPGIYFYVSGVLMAAVIDELGTQEQKEMFAMPMVEGPWGGTMVLTEADAGSDVGAGTTKAYQVEGDTYHLEGVKRFITSGEQDYHPNIIHLVLARPEGAGPGTKGLSMFIVPKFLVNPDGSLGERNGVFATNLEDKMGIRGSTTTELTFGMEKPCVGYLVGGSHEGIRQMFMVIEDARMLVGTKSMATLSTAYLNALDYAIERKQGADLANSRDPEAPRVSIIDHPDIRRLLMDQKSHAEGMRALVSYTAVIADKVKLDPDEAYWPKLQDLLLPLVKGYCSERAYDLIGQSIQVFGGSGYTKDYPIEQYARDAKIDTLYEGTTGIQAMDLFYRKIARDRGETLMRFAAEITETIKGGDTDDSLAIERERLGAAMDDVQGQLGVMVGNLMGAQAEPESIYKVGLHTNYMLDSLSELVIGWLLIKHAEIALAALEGASDSDVAFYEGKVASARWFARTALPKTALRRRLAEEEQGEIMALAHESF